MPTKRCQIKIKEVKYNAYECMIKDNGFYNVLVNEMLFYSDKWISRSLKKYKNVY